MLSCMPNSTSVNFGWIKWGSWVMWFWQKVLVWISKRWKQCQIGEDPIALQHCFSSSDRWAIREDYSDFRGYVEIKVVRDRLKAAQSRQKSYADIRMKDLEFQVGDWVFLKLSPWKGVVRFGKRGKLSPRMHNVFHVSMLRKYIADPSHVLQQQPISLQKDLTEEEEPVQILDRKEQVLRNKTIPLVKVLWRSHQVEEATRESEEQRI
ncbi:hypothetical protein ACLB2K_004607 [Fragaria x ananassa]